MDKKEITTSAIALILLLGVLGLIIALAPKKTSEIVSSNTYGNIQTTQDLNANEELGIPVEDSGFLERQKMQNENKTTNTLGSQDATQLNAEKKSLPTMQLKADTDYQAIIRTSKGDIKVDLYEKKAPITVNNFVTLARESFYNGTIFHRVIEDFMIQGGDPTGTGSGGPGYSFRDEINNEKLLEGSLAMANAGPNTNGSQFFIVTATSVPWLDGKHTNFGKILEGMDVADEISKVKKDSRDKPLENITIKSIEITENPL